MTVLLPVPTVAVARQPDSSKVVSPVPVLPDHVVLDTCVLLSGALRWLVFSLARQACLSVAWSAVIGDEWRRNGARMWSVDHADIQGQWQALQDAFPQACQGDVSAFKEGLRRSDPKDWHVVAAGRALHQRLPEARVAILTRNLRDFNRSELRQFNLDLLDPDTLLVRARQCCPEPLKTALAGLPAAVAAEGRSPEDLAVILRRERLFRLLRLSACQ